MITYVNSENTVKYRKLFEEANKILKKHNEMQDGAEITTLEDYFGYITKLAKYDHDDTSNNSPTYDPSKNRQFKYTILPVDEEVFVIDANTRTITVPPSFKKNGISVKGDEIAEILYFEIDRYFDATDLNTKEIYIQWETAPDAKGITEKNVSIPWVRDIISKPGKIIFGWPISSEITSRAGTIKFSVRFISKTNEEKPKITYSFSTLTASAVINPALDLDIEDDSAIEVIDRNDLILSRFVDTNPVGGQTAEKPVLFEDLPETINLEGERDHQSQILRVQAESQDAGVISISWTHMQNGHIVPSGDSKLTVLPDEYVLSNDGNFVKGKAYYTKVENDENISGYQIAEVTDGDPIPENTYYERFYACTISETGTYFATITNRVQISSDTIDTTKCVVPVASKPIINSFPTSSLFDADMTPVSLICLAQSPDGGELTYQWYSKENLIENANKNEYTANEEGSYSVIVTNHLNNSIMTTQSEVCRVTKPAAKPIIVRPLPTSEDGMVEIEMENGSAVLEVTLSPEVATDGYTYQWYKCDYRNDYAESGKQHPHENDEALLPETVQTTDLAIRYTTNASGYYYVKIINNLNGSQSEPTYSLLFKVAQI